MITQVLRYMRLKGKKGSADTNRTYAKAWIAILATPLLLQLLIEIKVSGHTSIARFIAFAVMMLFLCFLAQPMFLGASYIWGATLGRKSGKTRQESADEELKRYSTFIGVAALWVGLVLFFIAVMPVQSAPEFFWPGLIALLLHEFAYQDGWEKENDAGGRAGKRVASKVLIGLFLLFLTLMLGAGLFDYVYDKTGYEVPTLSGASVEERKTYTEDSNTADDLKKECITSAREARAKGAKTPREKLLTKSDWKQIKACQAQIDAVTVTPPSSQKEGEGGAGTHSWLAIVMATVGGLTALHIIGALLIAAVLGFAGYKLVKKSDDATTATKTVVVEKKKSSSSVTPVALILYLVAIYAAISWYNGGWITSSADVSHLGGKISRIFDEKPESEKVKAYPNAFLTPEEIKTWKAVGTSPSYHPNFGEIAGRSFEIVTGAQSGVRPNLYDRLEGGYGKPLIIMLEENNPARDIVLENTVCNEAKFNTNGRASKICTGNWRSGDRRIRGDYELIYTSESRVATLYSASGESIVFAFQPQ